MERELDHARVIAPPPLIMLAAVGAGFLLRLAWHTPLLGNPWRWPAAGGCLAVALLLSGSAVHEMRRARTSIIPHHSTTALVTSGPFRLTRNPLYVSLALVLASAGFAADSLAVLAMIVPWAVVMRFGVIAREENYLSRKFGEDYRAYCRRARRWL